MSFAADVGRRRLHRRRFGHLYRLCHRVVGAALGALWSPRSWRATLHALLGLALSVVTAGFLAALLILWIAAVYSLAEGPTGARVLAVIYVIAAVGFPVLLPWCVRGLAAMQRARFAAVLAVDIPAPPRFPAHRRGWALPARLVRALRAPARWRELSYLLFSVFLGGVGGGLVAICWTGVLLVVGVSSVGGLWGAGGRPALADTMTALGVAAALLLAAPWLARGVATIDVAVARRLLGPTRTEWSRMRAVDEERSRADIAAATDAERHRIERDLHDGAQQRLVSLAMNLGMARVALADTPAPTRAAIERAHDEATEALSELRGLVRGLHPAVVEDRGLEAALSGLVARAPLPVRLRVTIPTPCSPGIEAVAYFVVSEALTNIVKHAHATSAEVRAERSGDRLLLRITDDGRGGAAITVGNSPGRTGPQGTGVRGLAQRVAAVDGTLAVDSPAGGPTTVTVELPCE